MKKILILLYLFPLIGCSKQEYFVCYNNLYNEDQNYTYNATYKVYYKKNFVTKIERKEEYLSEDKKVLKYFNDYKNLEYQNFNDLYNGMVYNIKLKNDKVILTSTVDMTIVNTKQMVKDKYIDNNYIISNKLTIGGIKNIYKEKGFKCN